MTEIEIRASSWSTVVDCALRWYKVHVEGMRTYSRGRTRLGSATHEGTAVFDSGQGDASDAAHQFIDVLYQDSGDVIWDDISQHEAETIGLVLVADWCQRISPRWQWAAVEHTLEPQSVIVNDDVLVTMTGTLDRVYRHFRDETAVYGPLDIKSGARIVGPDGVINAAPHIAQVEQYRFLYQTETGIELNGPAMVGALPTAGNDAGTVSLGEISTRSTNLFYGEGGYLDTLAMYARTGLWPGNPSSALCSKKYCPNFNTCRWRAAA